jgi:hypothetical protein
VWRESKFAVSYLTVLNTAEVKLLIVAGACRQSADYLSFYALGYSHEGTSKMYNPHDLTPYFYGSITGLLLMGPMYDLWFSGAPYLIVTIMTSMMCVY